MKKSNFLFFTLLLFLFSSCAKEEVKPIKKTDNIEGKKASPPPVAGFFSFESEVLELTDQELNILTSRLENINSLVLISNCDIIDYVDFDYNENVVPGFDPSTGINTLQIVNVTYDYPGVPNNPLNNHPIWDYFGGDIEVRTSPVTYSSCPLIEFEFSNNTWQSTMNFTIDLVPIYQGGYCPINC